MNILNEPLVSVIVPTFNREELILKTINSILAQTYKNLELIIVSDCSTDNTGRIVRALDDERIRFFELSNNSGLPAVVRNYGIRESKGDFIAFCDDDDIWVSNKLSVQIAIMQRKNVDFCFSDISIFYGDNVENSNINLKRKLAIFFNLGFSDLILYRNLVSNATVVIDRKLLSSVGFLNEDPNLRAVEDYEFWIRCLMLARPYFCNERLIFYRIHSNRISNIDEGKSKRKYILNTLFKRGIITHRQFLFWSII
jgi:glycosyltransferase involved in cell wall biosynthesis